MWLFTEAGFFSVVQKGGGPDDLCVRARNRGDLEVLKCFCTTGPVQETPDADYRYRVMVRRGDLAKAVAHMVLTLDYSNFKNHVGEIDGYGSERLKAYHQVWGVMSAWQSGGKRRKRRTRGQLGFDFSGEQS
jgi:hypothetical protein